MLGGTEAIGKALVDMISSNPDMSCVVTSRRKRTGNGIVTYTQGNAHDKDFLASLLEKEYDEYIDICNVNSRSKDAYNSLIHDREQTPYDITKGAIVINQDDLIYDGQHRSCYLLYKYGPNYKVDVLQLFYKSHKGVGLVILTFKILIAKLRAIFLCLFQK